MSGGQLLIGGIVGGLLIASVAVHGERFRQARADLRANRAARPGLWRVWRFELGHVVRGGLLVLFVVGVLLAMVYMASTPEQR